MSKLADNEATDIKVIYDRIKLISKKDWDNIISIGEKTKIFGHGELANIKSIRNSLNKNEIIKELSIEKGFLSLKKLSSFGINV